MVTALLLGVLLWYRGEFYAVGDPRTRWRALWRVLALVVADVAIGLTFIMLASGPGPDYSLRQRVVQWSTGWSASPARSGSSRSGHATCSAS